PRPSRVSATIALTTTSGTSFPASMYPFASRPTGVWFWTAARSMSPVERWRRSWAAARRFACVPLPAPGGPKRMGRIGGGTWIGCAPARAGRAKIPSGPAGQAAKNGGRGRPPRPPVPSSPHRPLRLRVDGVGRGEGLGAVDLADDRGAVERLRHPRRAEEDAEGEEGARE